MSAAQLPQSENTQTVPYITVGTDARGGACWAVVGLGTVVRHLQSGLMQRYALAGVIGTLLIVLALVARAMG
jgi:hypothetical protein